MHTLILILSFLGWGHLTWEDFKGTGKETALTSTQINLETRNENGLYYHTATARFLPEKSYLNTDSQKILAHEQIHFDITELYSRRLNKAIEQYQGKGGRECRRVFVVYDSLCVEWQRTQNMYDKETNHSINEKEQARWEKLVSNELNK